MTQQITSLPDEIRKEISDLRNGMSRKDWKAKSDSICKKVIGMPVYQEAETVLIFMSISHEPDTGEIIRHALTSGKTVAIPKCEDRDLVFYRIYSTDNVSPGRFSVPEPVNTDEIHRVRMNDQSLIILPGLAFDKKGFRLGYGAGFYDRYLKEDPYRNKLMIAFSFQEVDQVPTHPGDVPVDWIVTDKEITEV